mmetsp:Transcript_101796/g.180518  ORF Transcript_101796/g.180518 Transcript_101796/m.180518 type:complete len:421 (+) Transcript_101796:128-1390(+)
MATSELDGRRATLEQECQDLRQERAAEHEATEQLQAALLSEMRQLRDQCHEEGMTIGLLSETIDRAADNMTMELHDMMALRAELQAELLREEAQRRSVEADQHAEEEEIRRQLEVMENQLEHMHQARVSLGAHLERIGQTKAWLRRDIDVERDSRTKQEVTGQLKLAHSEKNEQVRHELEVHAQAHRSSLDAWRARAFSEVADLRKEHKQHAAEEHLVRQKLQHTEELHAEEREQLRAEDATLKQHREELVACIRQARKDEDATARHVSEHEEISVAVKGLNEKCSACDEDLMAVDQQVSQTQQHARELREICKQEEAEVERHLAEPGMQTRAVQFSLPKAPLRKVSMAEQRQEIGCLARQLSELTQLCKQEEQRHEELRLRQMELNNRSLFACFRTRPQSGGPSFPLPVSAPSASPDLV